MANFYLKKGHNLKITGEPTKVLSTTIAADKVYLHPKDFKGIKPKLMVKQDDAVSVGSPIFYDKLNPDVKFVSPVSGVVSDIQFGDRRAIERIVITNDGSGKSVSSKSINIENSSKADLLKCLSESGLWPNIRQRPFSKIANPNQTPRDIFISVNTTAPFAPESLFILDGREEHFQSGLDVLAKLTSGIIHLNMSESETSPIFVNAKNVQHNKFTGEHPSGNVGIQIHHIAPIASKDDIVWYLDAQSVADIGEFLNTGLYPSHKIITLCGSSVLEPTYVKITKGASIGDILFEKLNPDKTRIISGDVLSGESRSLSQGIRFYDETISVIPECTEREFLGWALPGLSKYSVSRTFLSALLPKKPTNLNTSMNGSHRAIISFGRWESVLPMDILPEFLIKSILANDIEEMEKLGIYECAEEDFALCSFVCQSKIDVSGIIRSGLLLAEKEG